MTFPPWQTVYWYFMRWHDEGTVARLHDTLRAQVRRAGGREAEPGAGQIDLQSVRTADTAPSATRGFDAGNKVKGYKRFRVTGTFGLKQFGHDETDGPAEPTSGAVLRPESQPCSTVAVSSWDSASGCGSDGFRCHSFGG